MSFHFTIKLFIVVLMIMIYCLAVHPDLSKVYECLECDYKSKQKGRLNRHIQKEHLKDFGLDNNHFYRSSTKTTSTATKSISPLRLEHETLLPNHLQSKEFQLNPDLSSETPKKMLHETEPVIIRFVSRKRRLSKGNNSSFTKKQRRERT